MIKLVLVAIIVFLINLPFGAWRAKLKKFSPKWFMSIHIPVPLIYALRIYAGISWHFITFPFLIGSFFLGQYIGKRYIKV
ncbi:MAG: hypothetical protein ACM3Q2_16210 [Syntrophothermus sp.]